MAVFRDVIQLLSAARTAAGNSDTGIVGELKELLVGISVTAVSGTNPSITPRLESIGADGAWYPLWTASAAMTGGGTVLTSVGLGEATNEALGETVRIAWAFAGTSTPIVTFSGSVQGR